MDKEYLRAKLQEFQATIEELKARQRTIVVSIHQHEGAILLLRELLEKLREEDEPEDDL